MNLVWGIEGNGMLRKVFCDDIAVSFDTNLCNWKITLTFADT